MNRWTYGYGLVTLTRKPADLPCIRCYGTGETKKEAVRAWVADWRAAQEMVRRTQALPDNYSRQIERIAA